MNEKVLSVILGGGQGSRLYPLTQNRSKPAVPIGGKYRLVDIPISNCLNSGLKRIFVLTQFNSASLNKHIKNTYHFDHFSNGFVDILAAEQTPDNPTWFQGTADAVRQSIRHLLPFEFDYILILSGDQLYQMDFDDMLRDHMARKAEISIATIPVHANDATEFGIMKTNPKGQITSFIEKPARELLPEWTSEVSEDMKAERRHYLASMGIYIFNRQTLVDLLGQNPDAKDFGKEIIPMSISSRKVVSYQYEGYWTDIGNISSFFEANLGLTDTLPKFNLFDNDRFVYTRARMLPPSKLSGTTLERTMLAEGCIINASRIERTLIGIRTRIGVGTTVVNSIVMGNDYYQSLEEINALKTQPAMGIGERCYLRNVIVDKNVCIGNDVRINGGPHLGDVDTDLFTIKDGIVVIKKGVVIPNGFAL